MVQFPSRFIPDLSSTLAADPWAPTKTTSEFVRSPEHQSAVDRIKKAIPAPTSLQYLDSSKSVIIQVDASQRGIGAVFLQDNVQWSLQVSCFWTQRHATPKLKERCLLCFMVLRSSNIMRMVYLLW